MLPNKSTNNINNSTMLDTGSSSGPQPLLSTSVQPPSNFTTNNANKQRRPKMESSNPNKPSHNSNKSGSHQGGGHHQPHHHQLHQTDSKLYTMSNIELKDPLEITLEEAFIKLKGMVCPSDLQQKPDSILFNEMSNYSNREHSNLASSSIGYLTYVFFKLHYRIKIAL